MYTALFSQAGVLEVTRVEDLVNYASLLSTPILDLQNRVGIVAAGGAMSVLSADAFERAGLKIPGFTVKTVEQLRARLTGVSILENPLDLGMTPQDERGFRNLGFYGELILANEDIDWLVFVNNGDIFKSEELVSAAQDLQRTFPKKKVATVWHSARNEEVVKAMKSLGRSKVSSFDSLGTAASAMVGYLWYAHWRNLRLKHDRSSKQA